MSEKLTLFVIFKFILHFMILLVDSALLIRLLADKHYIWAALSGTWIVLAYLVALSAVTIGKYSTGDFMSCTKFILLGTKVHAEFVAAFFHSAPQVVTQLAVYWSAIYGHDFETFNDVGSSRWLFAIIEVLSPFLNFVSLVSTGVSYNGEPGPWARQVCHAMSVLITCLLRVFVFSIILKVAPLISVCVLSLLLMINITMYSVCGESYHSVILGYVSLFLPCGHNNAQALKSAKFPFQIGLPELERSRINHEGMLTRVQKYFGLQLFVTLALNATMITFTEIWLFDSELSVDISPILQSRVFIYCTGFVLSLISLVIYGLYYIQCKAAREAARTWTGLGPARSPLVSRIQDPESNTEQPTASREAGATARSTDVRPRLPQSADAGRRPPSQYSVSPSAPRISSEYRLSGGLDPPGNRKCDNEDCVTCTWLIEGPYFYSSVSKRQYLFMTPVTCTDTSIIYMVTCHRCSKQYVGKTQNSLRERHYGHRREIDTLSSPLGKHFGEICGIDSWRIQIIDKCQSHELKSREAYWMHEVKSLAPSGLNIRDEAGGGVVRGAAGDRY